MFAKRIRWRAAIRPTLPVALVACVASTAVAQRAHVGPRIGANFDFDDVLLGVHLTAPLASRLEFYPSFDIYFPDAGTRLGFNGDLKYRLPTREGVAFYLGGGLNVLYREVGNLDDTDLGGNLLGGVEARGGWVHPFFEGRVLLHDNTSFQLVGGLNITLGRH